MRASRCVVDTGMRSLGWTRDQAIAFFEENTLEAPGAVRKEVDRYLSQPGQAVSYKVGEIALFKMRRTAEGELGTRFDLRRFHDLVLGFGNGPITALESRCRAWIESEKAGGSERLDSF